MIEDAFSLYLSFGRYGHQLVEPDELVNYLNAAATCTGWTLTNVRRDTVSDGERRVFDIAKGGEVVYDCDLFTIQRERYSVCLIGISQTAAQLHKLFSGCQQDSLTMKWSVIVMNSATYAIGTVGFETSLLNFTIESICDSQCVLFRKEWLPRGFEGIADRAEVDGVCLFSNPGFANAVRAKGYSTSDLLRDLTVTRQ